MKTRSKTSLFLMELVLMILFFALSSAICMRVFASAQLTARRSGELSSAALAAQSAAECYKASGGDADFTAATLGGASRDGGMALYLDGDFNACGEESAKFVLTLSEAGGRAEIEVRRAGDGGSVFSLTVKAVPNGQ